MTEWRKMNKSVAKVLVVVKIILCKMLHNIHNNFKTKNLFDGINCNITNCTYCLYVVIDTDATFQ